MLIKLARKEDNQSNAASVAKASAYAIASKKTFDWGAPRVLGFHQGMHGTSSENYKNIKKNNFMLDPEFGGSDVGSGHYVNSDHCKRQSKGYVHIFGVEKNEKNRLAKKIQQKIMQRPLARFHAQLSKKGPGKSLYVFVPYDLNGFEADRDYGGIAIKTKNALKTGSNRYHSMINAVKQYGIKNGIKNIPRFATGIGLLGASAYSAKKSFDNLRRIRKSDNEF